MKAIIRAVAGAILAGLVLTSGTSVTHGLSGGQASSEAPWSVRIIADGKEICSGSVIAARLVLTARHCVEGYRSWTVYLPSKAVVTKTKEYAPSSVGDAAILVLSQDSGVAPVRLASKTQATSFVNRGVTFFGWGWTGIRKDGSKTIGTGLPSKVQKSPNGAYFLAKYC
ncbi:MAG: trypsin-like serine protease, partial [Propionicimonas sp.]